jgi:hypothetical protein
VTSPPFAAHLLQTVNREGVGRKLQAPSRRRPQRRERERERGVAAKTQTATATATETRTQNPRGASKTTQSEERGAEKPEQSSPGRKQRATTIAAAASATLRCPSSEQSPHRLGTSPIRFLTQRLIDCDDEDSFTRACPLLAVVPIRINPPHFSSPLSPPTPTPPSWRFWGKL